MKKITSLVIVLTMVFTAFAIFTTGSSAAELTTDGLVSSFEGSSYEGTTWTDLVGENDITDCVGKFENGAYVVGLGQQQMLPQALYEALGGEEYTFELNLGSFSGGEGIQYYGWLCNNNGTTAEKFALFITVSEKALYIKTAGRPKTYRPKLAAETTEALVEQLQDATISVTYKSGDKVKLYVNGVLVDEKDAPATNANTGSKFQLGNSDAKKTTNSEYQAMRFYNKALTAEQIAANYAYDNAPKVSSTESVVIYNPDKGVAMTANKVEDREKLVGVEATANKDGTLTVADDSYVVLTKTNYDNSTFTLTANGKYLTSGATGNSLSFTDEATEYSYWTAEETDGTVYYKNVAAEYQGGAQYLEYFSGFTTYGMRTPGAAYQFTFYDASKVSVQETDPEPPVVTGEETVIIAALAVVALFGTAIVIKKVND